MSSSEKIAASILNDLKMKMKEGTAKQNTPLTIDQIRLVWGDKKPEAWNTTHVQHIVYAIFENKNVPENFNFMMQSFKKFIVWRNEQPDEYIPQTGLETMYTKAFLQDVYEYCEKLTLIEEDEKEAKEALNIFLTDMLTKHGKPRMITALELLNGPTVSKEQPKLDWKVRLSMWMLANPILSSSILFGTLIAGGAVLGSTATIILQRVM